MNPIERLYREFPVLLLARRNLTRTTIRTVLAMLGIVIGVLAIASLGIFGAALQASVTGSLGQYGTQLVVSPGEDIDHLTDADVREIRRVSGDARVVPVKRPDDPGELTVRGETQRLTVYGMDNPGDAYGAADGRIPTPLRSGVLVGTDVAREHDIRVGQSVAVNDQSYRVQAILAEQEQFAPVNVDGAVILPERSVESDGYQQIVVVADTADAANASAVAIQGALNEREERVSIFELSRLTAQISSVFDTINLFLIGIGSISLFVAGVSILNVMLMSTIERRGEIGVLRAVGYQRTDVLRIMLSEALLLGVVGGIVGAALSLGAGLVIYNLILGVPLAVFAPTNAVYVGAAFGFAILTSVLSGLYPAYKAANEQPVEALRS